MSAAPTTASAVADSGVADLNRANRVYAVNSRYFNECNTKSAVCFSGSPRSARCRPGPHERPKMHQTADRADALEAAFLEKDQQISFEIRI